MNYYRILIIIIWAGAAGYFCTKYMVMPALHNDEHYVTVVQDLDSVKTIINYPVVIGDTIIMRYHTNGNWSYYSKDVEIPMPELLPDGSLIMYFEAIIMK